MGSDFLFLVVLSSFLSCCCCVAVVVVFCSLFWVSLVLGNESIEWKIEIKTECNEILKIEERIKNVKEGTLRWLGLTKEKEEEEEEDVLEIEIGQHVESWVEKKKNENATVRLVSFWILDFLFLF